MQTLTFNTGATNSTVNTAGITSPISGRTNARTLVINNKEFVAKETTAYMNATYPDHKGKYDEEAFEKRIEEILDSVSLDALLGNNANFLSRYAGLTYYASVEGQKLIGTQKTETVGRCLCNQRLLPR